MQETQHITQPDKSGYQVRIVRGGKEYSRYFSHKLWGGKDKALKSAQNWRDQRLVALGKKNQNLAELNPLSSNKSTGIRGVSRAVSYDKRKDAYYLVYQVHWRDKGKTKNKKFQVGRVGEVSADDEFHAFRTAVHFRKEFEWCVQEKRPFEPERYTQWKRIRVYENGVSRYTAPGESSA